MASGHQTTSKGPVVLHPGVKGETLLEWEPVGDRIISTREFQTLQTCHHTRLCTNKQSRKGWLVGGSTRSHLQAPSWCYAVDQGQHECRVTVTEPQGVMAGVWWHQQGVCFKTEKLFHCFWASGWSSWWVLWYQRHMGNQEAPVGAAKIQHAAWGQQGEASMWP